MNENASNGNTAGSAFAPIWRRKWLILAVAVVVAVATYEYYKHVPAVYSAATQLYLGGTSEPQAGTGSGSGSSKGLSARTLADQVGLINSAVIGGPVRKRLKAEGKTAAARGKAKAGAAASSDFISISTEAHTPKAARDLADGYAAEYIKRQRTNYVRSITKQITTSREQLRRIEAPVAPKGGKGKGKGGTTTTSASSTIQAANLQSKISVLESELSTFAGVQQVHPAISAPVPVEPAPKQNAIFGFVLGLILAAIAAFLFGRVDRRLRTLEDVESTFGTRILAALPEVKAPVLRPDGRRYPAKSLLESLRRLQTTLAMEDFAGAGADHRPRTILFVSADAGDGRSSLIANLARVQSEGGDRVAVVEADFRRPTLAALLGADGEYGLADVLTGRVKLDEAIRPVKLEAAPMQEAGSPLATQAAPSIDGHVGSVSLIAGGGVAANPPALIGSGAMRELLVALASDYDVVLVDAPPPLEVSDAMPLMRLVDGIILIARLGHTREASAYRLTQLMQRTTTAPLLGAVGNCVSRRDINRYGFSYAPVKQSRRGLLRR